MVAIDGLHWLDNHSQDNEFGLLSQYHVKMSESLIFFGCIFLNTGLEVKKQWQMFQNIESKRLDWPEDTEKEGLSLYCL